MTLLLAGILATSPIAVGKATRYNANVMEQVVANRIKWGHIDPTVYHDGYVAVADCRFIAGCVYLQLPDGRISGPHLVADCGAAHDQQHLIDIGFAVDLSYELAKTLGVIDKPLENVTVWLCEDFHGKKQRRKYR